jgi:hypothetical protein
MEVPLPEPSNFRSCFVVSPDKTLEQTEESSIIKDPRDSKHLRGCLYLPNLPAL